MPLPKMPAKPATLLAPGDYPKAEKGKTVKPSIKLLEPAAPAAAPAAEAQKSQQSQQAPQARKTADTVADKPRAKVLKAVETRAKSSASRAADKAGGSKLFVLDTNVLMHDPSSLFRFEEHDVYLP